MFLPLFFASSFVDYSSVPLEKLLFIHLLVSFISNTTSFASLTLFRLLRVLLYCIVAFLDSRQEFQLLLLVVRLKEDNFKSLLNIKLTLSSSIPPFCVFIEPLLHVFSMRTVSDVGTQRSTLIVAWSFDCANDCSLIALGTRDSWFCRALCCNCLCDVCLF